MKLQKKTPTSVSPKIQPETAAWLKAAYGSVNRGAAYACDLLPGAVKRTLAEIKGQFSKGELGMILDIMNGTVIDPADMAGQWILPNLEDAFFLDPGMYEEKWDIPDSADFINRFKGLTHFQKIALEAWVALFWADCDNLNLDSYLQTQL